MSAKEIAHLAAEDDRLRQRIDADQRRRREILYGDGDELNDWYFAPDSRLDGMCPREAIEAGGVQMARLLANLEDLASGGYA